MNERRKLASNAFYLFLDWLLISLVNFLFWSIVGKFLNPNEYGIVTTSISLAAFVSGVSLLGLTSAISKLIPEYLVKNQERKIFSLIKFTLKITLISNLVILVFMFLLRCQISSLLKMPLDSLYLVLIAVVILSLTSLFGSIIYAYQEMRFFMMTDVLGSTIKLIITFLLFFFFLDYRAPLLGFIVGCIVMLFLRLLRVRIGEDGLIEKEKIFTNFALPAFISGLAMGLFSYSHYFFLSSFKTTEASGIFGVAMIISNVILTIPSILTSALFPIISSLSAYRNKKKNQRYLIEVVLRYTLFISIPLSVFFTLFSRQLVVIFSSEKYLEASSIIPLLALSNVVFALGNLFSPSLYAIGKTKLQRNIVLFSVSIYFILAFVLVSKYSYFGISLSYLASTFFFFTLSFTSIKKHMNVRFPLKDMFKILISTLIAFSLFYFLVKIEKSLIVELIFLAPISFLYLTILFLLRFYREEDLKVVKFLLSKMSRFRFLEKVLSFVERYV